MEMVFGVVDGNRTTSTSTGSVCDGENVDSNVDVDDNRQRQKPAPPASVVGIVGLELLAQHIQTHAHSTHHTRVTHINECVRSYMYSI